MQVLTDIILNIYIAISNSNYDSIEHLVNIGENLIDEKETDINNEIYSLCEDRKDYVSLLQQKYKDIKTIELIEDIKENNKRKTPVLKGGYGNLYNGTIYSSQDLKDSNKHVKVIVKHVKATDKSRGSDTLNEITIMKDVCSDSKYLMPLLYCKIDNRTSEIKFAMPLGIGDMSYIIRKSKLNPYGNGCETKRRWIQQICKGVEELHSFGILHADIKPGNIILFPVVECETILKLINIGTCDSHNLNNNLRKRIASLALNLTSIRISDFGISSICLGEKYSSLEQGHNYIYTSLYRPPEVWNSKIENEKSGSDAEEYKGGWSFPADIWALGCTVYEIIFSTILFVDQKQKAAHLIANGIETISFYKLEKILFLDAIIHFTSSYNLHNDLPISTSPQLPEETSEVSSHVSQNSLGVLRSEIANESKKISECEKLSGKAFVKSSFDLDGWEKLPTDCKTFISSMLKFLPKDRLTIFDLLNHPYIETKNVYKINYPSFSFSNLNLPSFDNLPETSFDKEKIDVLSSLETIPACEYMSCIEKDKRLLVLRGIADDLFSDKHEILKYLSIWLCAKHLPFLPRNKSIRLRKISLKLHLLMCGCIASKILRQINSSGDLIFKISKGCDVDNKFSKKVKILTSPSIAKEEKVICEDLDYILFPFKELKYNA